MLLIPIPADDPVLALLSPGALRAWLEVVAHCGSFRTDLVGLEQLQGVDSALIDEWDRAHLVSRLPFGHLRVLARGRLWDYD
jgi:hypothetical protein